MDFPRGRQLDHTSSAHMTSHGIPMTSYSEHLAPQMEQMDQPCLRHDQSSEPLDLSIRPRESNRKHASSTSSPRHSPYTLPGTSSASPRHSPYPAPSPLHGHYSYSQRQLASPAYQLPVTASSSAPSSYVASSPFEILTTSNNVINGGLADTGGIFRPYSMDVDMMDVNSSSTEELASHTPEGQGHHHNQMPQQEEEYTKEYTTLEPIHRQSLLHSSSTSISQSSRFDDDCNTYLYSHGGHSQPYYLKSQHQDLHQPSPATTISHKRSSSEPTTMTLSQLMNEGICQEDSGRVESTSGASIPGQGAPPLPAPIPRQGAPLPTQHANTPTSQSSPTQRSPVAPPPPPPPPRSRQYITHTQSTDQQLDPDSSSDSIPPTSHGGHGRGSQNKKAGRYSRKESKTSHKGKSPSPVPSPGSRSKENRKSPIDITQTPSGKQFCDPKHVLGNYDWSTLQSKQSLNADLSLIYLQGPSRLSQVPGDFRPEQRSKSKVFLSDLLDQTVEICVKMPSPAIMAVS